MAEYEREMSFNDGVGFGIAKVEATPKHTLRKPHVLSPLRNAQSERRHPCPQNRDA